MLTLFDKSQPETTRYSARQPGEERSEMRNLFLAAFAVLSLGVAMAPAANAFSRGFPQSTYHSGPYDDTGHGPGQTGLEGGGG
jgi:hypothetical protein